MRQRLYLIILLLFSTATATFLYWRCADWRAYVQDPVRGAWPKFMMPTWWQLAESLAIGTVMGSLVVGLAFCVMWAWGQTQRAA